MTPKEKAQELVNKMFFSIVDRKNVRTLIDYWDEAKQCALICVDEIMLTPMSHFPESMGIIEGSYQWWQQVKLEIEKL